MMLSLDAHAFSFGNDVFKFTGDVYIDAYSNPTETFGLGRVSTITQGGDIIWASGDNGQYLNFIFGGYTPVVAPIPPIYNFVAQNGFVDFYINNSATVFNTLLNFVTVSAAISAGDLFLSTTAVGPTVGIGTPVSYSANGFLDVVGGLFAAQLDTSSRATFTPGVFADLSVGLVGANNTNPLVNPQYAYISSVDAQGASVAIPEPMSLMLMGIGMIAIAIQRYYRAV